MLHTYSSALYVKHVQKRIALLMNFVQRVMPTCIFILQRFTLRVDNVLFRTYDTRMYHSFASSPPLVVRETSGWEAPYGRVKSVSQIWPVTFGAVFIL